MPTVFQPNGLRFGNNYQTVVINSIKILGKSVTISIADENPGIHRPSDTYIRSQLPVNDPGHL